MFVPRKLELEGQYLWCSIVSAIISNGFLLLLKNKLKSNSDKVIFT